MKASKAAILLSVVYGFSRSADAAPAVNQTNGLQSTFNTTASSDDTQFLSLMPVSYTNGSIRSLGEPQPASFLCAMQYKARAKTLYKIEVLLVLVTALSRLGLLQWNEIQESFTHEYVGLQVRFASTRAAGQRKLATKEMMWALRIVSKFLHTEKSGYEEINFQPFYDGSDLLGSGQLTKKGASSTPVPSDGASNVAVTKRADMGAEHSGNGSVIQLPDALTAGASNAAAVIEDFQVYRDAKSFEPFDIFTILMNINVLTAEEVDKDATMVGIQGLDPPQKWQVAMSALNKSSPALTHRIIMQAIADLALSLATVRPEQYRWKEAAFKIKDNGHIVGVGYIHHTSR